MEIRFGERLRSLLYRFRDFRNRLIERLTFFVFWSGFTYLFIYLIGTGLFRIG